MYAFIVLMHYLLVDVHVHSSARLHHQNMRSFLHLLIVPSLVSRGRFHSRNNAASSVTTLLLIRFVFRYALYCRRKRLA